MNIRLTSSSLTVAVSAKSVLGSSNKSANENHVAASALTSRVNSSYHEDNAAAAAQRRRTKQKAFSQSFSNANNEATAGKVSATDVGVLGGSDIVIGRLNRHDGNGLLFGNNQHRRVQEEEVTCMKPDTCEPNLCACVAAGGKAFQCASELNAVCNGVTGEDGTEFDIEGCVNWPDYYRDFYCPFAKCMVEEGGTLGSCGCAFYAKSYETYKDDPRYVDDAETQQHFAAHACCVSKADEGDEGMRSCLENAPTSMPSVAPSAPTTSPTENPTDTPTVTASPTISPKPTSSPTTPGPTKKEEMVVTPPTDDTDPPPASTESPPANPPTPNAPAPPTSSAETIARWGGNTGTAMPFIVATIVWSLFG